MSTSTHYIATIWRNNKNNHLYKVLHYANDCTNSRDGNKVIVYTPANGESEAVFVRDEAEFLLKFTRTS
jgi:hypothetical protein